jgi:glycerol-3-phosphate dehydrogenase
MLNVPVPGHFGRIVFAVPRADGLVMIGLTDEPFEGDTIPDAPEVPADDERFLLETVSSALQVTLRPEDIVGRFAGLRPLLAAGGDTTADISRRHAVLEDPSTGVVTVVGGKLTTYRQMAQDAVDVVAARLGAEAACRTTQLPLVGAPTPRSPVDRSLPNRLVRRFGTEAGEIVALADGRPELLEPLPGTGGVLGVELLAAVQREGAVTLEDVVERRTRAGLVPDRRAAFEAAAGRILPALAETAAAV